MKKLVLFLAIVGLILLQQDFWLADRIEPLVLGFVPIGLAYQASISILAAVVWALLVRFAWLASADFSEAASPGEARRSP